MKYNQLNSRNSIIPNYRPQTDFLNIRIAYDYQGNIAIMRYLDGNYISWFHYTTVENTDLKLIIQDLLNSKVEYYGHESTFLHIHNISSINYLYTCNFNFDGITWSTPLKHGYSSSQPENFSRWIASDIRTLYIHLKEMTRFRTINSNYDEYLHNYCDVYKKQDPLAYHQLDPLHQLIEDERYLLLSDDFIIRELFIKCIEEKNKLYNQYMSNVR